MTTSSNTTAVAHGNDADFQTWITELSGMFDTVGFPKSADTGQINVATATRPALNTAAGYEIRYLNDSLHATKPIYVKIEYGTGNGATVPSIWISAASATNGAGTLSGTTYFARAYIPVNNSTPGAGTYFTGVCCREGYLAVTWKRGAQTQPAFFAIARLCDSAGAITSAGFVLYRTAPALGGTSTLYRWTYTTSEVNDIYGYALWPGGAAVSLVSGAPQVLRHYAFTPEIQVVPQFLSYLDTEIGNLSTFSFTPVGATSRTYIALGGTGSAGALTNVGLSTNAAKADLRLAMQWE